VGGDSCAAPAQLCCELHWQAVALMWQTLVHLPNYTPGYMLCSLGVKDKFILFVQDTIDPITVLNVAFSSAVDQAEGSESRFGQGMKGYGKRLGANEASDASGRFFSEFLFPTMLAEDPRYYRLGRGSGGRRLLHALEHAIVAHRDSGGRMPNISEWAGTTSGVLLSDLYHRGTTHGAGSIATQVSWNILQDTGFTVLREFWPEIARKFHVPFRDASAPIVRPVK
jgi:hypothetical protein